ncbi:MAG: STAS domain-containing protein [Clostridia bacterium]|nr:STAS domain-containing protein [Clostridia bacterium]
MIKTVENDVMKLNLEDDLIAKNVKTLNMKLMDMMDEFDDVSEVVLDMATVKNIDSVGVTFVINLYKKVSDTGGNFRVVHSSEDIRQLFKLMKLEDFFDL